MWDLHCVTVGRANWFNLILLIWFLELKIIFSLFYLLHLILSPTFKLNLASICPWSWWVTGGWLTRTVTMWMLPASPVMPVPESRRHHWVTPASPTAPQILSVNSCSNNAATANLSLLMRSRSDKSGLSITVRSVLSWPNPPVSLHGMAVTDPLSLLISSLTHCTVHMEQWEVISHTDSWEAASLSLSLWNLE